MFGNKGLIASLVVPGSATNMNVNNFNRRFSNRMKQSVLPYINVPENIKAQALLEAQKRRFSNQKNRQKFLQKHPHFQSRAIAKKDLKPTQIVLKPRQKKIRHSSLKNIRQKLDNNKGVQVKRARRRSFKMSAVVSMASMKVRAKKKQALRIQKVVKKKIDFQRTTFFSRRDLNIHNKDQEKRRSVQFLQKEKRKVVNAFVTESQKSDDEEFKKRGVEVKKLCDENNFQDAYRTVLALNLKYNKKKTSKLAQGPWKRDFFQTHIVKQKKQEHLVMQKAIASRTAIFAEQAKLAMMNESVSTQASETKQKSHNIAYNIAHNPRNFRHKGRLLTSTNTSTNLKKMLAMKQTNE